MKEIWRNLDGPPKNKELRSYVVKFEYKTRGILLNSHVLQEANQLQCFYFFREVGVSA